MIGGGRFAELDKLHVPGRLATRLLAVDLDGDGRAELLYGAGDNRLVIARF